MFTKTTFALAIIIGTASCALAATKQQSVAPNGNVYNAQGAYVGTDPDSRVRFELRRDGGEHNWIDLDLREGFWQPASGPAAGYWATALALIWSAKSHATEMRHEDRLLADADLADADLHDRRFGVGRRFRGEASGSPHRLQSVRDRRSQSRDRQGFHTILLSHGPLGSWVPAPWLGREVPLTRQTCLPIPRRNRSFEAPMTVIAMTREIGSFGLDVAAGLAAGLGLEIIQSDTVANSIAERSFAMRPRRVQ
jgi:hypothetical protein